MNKDFQNINKNEQPRDKPKLGQVGMLQQQLYAKKSQLKPYERRTLSQEETEVASSWEKKEEGNMSLVEKEKRTKKPMTLYAKLFIASILFFLVTMGAAVSVFIFGQNQVSYNEVTMSVLGPNSVAGGDTLYFEVQIANDNTVPLELTDIIVEYPKGTNSAQDGLSLDKEIQNIDNLPAGAQDARRFGAVLFGKEGEQKEIKITYQYRVPGSNNLFTKERLYKVLVESAPVVLEVRSQNAYLSGSEVTIHVDVKSNANKNVNNLLLEVDVPFGFSLASSTIEKIDGITVFEIGTLKPGEVKTLTLVGTLVGQDEEERVFRYILGAREGKGGSTIGSVFTVSDSTITIQKPPVTLVTSSRGDESTIYNVRPEEKISFNIDYINNTSQAVVDASIKVEINGSLFKPRTVDADSGFYRSSDNTIVYDASNTPGFSNIEANARGQVNFSFETEDLQAIIGRYQNPEVNVVVTFVGTSFVSDNEPVEVTMKNTKRIKIGTVLSLAQRLLSSVGPIENVGPLQPTVDTLSTYTVAWSIANSSNGVTAPLVKAKLPGYVVYTGNISPSNANITYNERTREVQWQPGTLIPALGHTTPAKEVFFQVSMEPSLSQVGNRPLMVSGPVVTGKDDFTAKGIQVNFEELTTANLANDPEYGERGDVVTE